MPKSETLAPAATVAAPAPNRSCPGCPAKFAPGGRGMGKTFCSDVCRMAFQSRMKAEGSVLAALVKAHNLTRHAKEGSREAEICRFARSQITQIAGHFSERDAENGRPSAVSYVDTLMRSGFNYFDRAR